MSVEASRWAWRQRAGGQLPKLLLVILGRHCREDGECAIGRAELAAAAECALKSVSRALALLEYRGLVFRPKRSASIIVLHDEKARGRARRLGWVDPALEGAR